MTIVETQEYKDLLQARQFVREHRVRFVNEISTPAWRCLNRAENHLDNQLSELTSLAFYAPDEPTYSTAGLDPQFAEVPNAR